MIWNPWHGCHRYSEGCLHCYIHKGDYKRNVDTSIITKTKDFDKPIQKKINAPVSEHIHILRNYIPVKSKLLRLMPILFYIPCIRQGN